MLTLTDKKCARNGLNWQTFNLTTLQMSLHIEIIRCLKDKIETVSFEGQPLIVDGDNTKPIKVSFLTHAHIMYFIRGGLS